MSNLIFIGGPHGVGKTSVIDELKRRNPTLVSYNPAELFWRYHFHADILEVDTIEEMIFESFHGIAAPTVLVNWHYSVWAPDGYIPQMNWDRWKRFTHFTSPHVATFLLLTASPEEIYLRRKKDIEAGVKKRKLDLQAVRKELEMEREFFERHVRITRMNGMRYSDKTIENRYLKRTVNQVQTILNKLPP